ncbi:MAG: RpiB/LacA/LacB family sugar-phosphate isomerase [bacterium]|nr:RpiB/LacA/LacB family sugar-phosphate isomerase [bacterium]MDA1024578.1 RpiB/LacA/LacB family sugar-phosphate isomerase [bacterium]
MPKTIFLGSDHAGFALKESAKTYLKRFDVDVEDLGAHTLDPNDDYPVYAKRVANAVNEHADSLGLLFCGNAEGICITANKFDGIRAGIGYSKEAASTMRNDDHANILCLPGRLHIKDDPLQIIRAFLEHNPSMAPRHLRRLNAIQDIEANN